MDSASRRLAAINAHVTGGGLESDPSSVLSNSCFSTGGHSVWETVPQGPADPILGIQEAFKADNDPRKLNLGVGAYRTEEGKPLVLESVREAERRLLANPGLNHEYLPITGNAEFCRLSARLAFGDGFPALAERRVVTVQSLSGTGSLRVGAQFLATHYPGHEVLVPNPTWPTHNRIFPLAGIPVRHYRYFHPKTRGLDYEGMLEDLRAAPEGSILLLHACAHNPTGVDPTPAQWDGIRQVAIERRLLPFFDSAYQGFASGSLERDAAPLRHFANAGLELLLAQSYAKNMGLYGERVGALSIVTGSADVARRVESQLKQVIRPMYSNPPAHGAAVVQLILSDSALTASWRRELAGMSGRIQDMRRQLHDALLAVGAPGDWSHILEQIGMFSYTGLTKAQVEHLTRKWHVYMTLDGRISMAGLSRDTCGYLAQAMNDAVRNC